MTAEIDQKHIISETVERSKDDYRLNTIYDQSDGLAVLEDNTKYEQDDDWEPEPSQDAEPPILVATNNGITEPIRFGVKSSPTVDWSNFQKSHRLMRTQLPRRSVDDNKNYMCKACKRCYSTLPNTLQHLITFHSDKVFCLECNTPFADDLSLEAHMKTHVLIRVDHRNRIYSLRESHKIEERLCTHCNKTFNNNESLKQHQYQAHATSKFFCKYCGETFFQPDERARHQLAHERGMNYECYLCPRSFLRKKQLVEHYLTCHRTDEDDVKEMQRANQFILAKQLTPTGRRSRTLTRLDPHTGKEVFLCEVCSEHFGSKYFLRKHFEKMHPDKLPFKCPICRMNFHGRFALERHQRAVGHLPGNNKSAYTSTCHLCSRHYPTQRAMEEHMRLMHSNRTINRLSKANSDPDIKPTVQTEKIDEDQHNDDKLSEGNFSCRQCSMTFDTKANYQLHMEKHSGDFKCLLCRLFFSSRMSLQIHMTMAHWHRCLHCKRRFKSSAHLKNHAITSVRCRM